MLAGALLLVYKYAGFILLQQFVTTASFRETVVNGRTIRPLVEWGKIIGVGDPFGATRAELVIRVTVDVQTGFLPNGSQLLFPSTGVLYQTVGSVALDAATVDVTARAMSDQSDGGGLGEIGNLVTNDVLSFASPLPNVANEAVVVSQTVAGVDEEKEDVYRGRVVERFSRRPQGGAYADYRLWAMDAAGIVRAFPYTADRPGEVDVYIEATEASSGSVDGIPDAGQIAAVVALIDLDSNGLATRRPANAAVNVKPITRRVFDIEVQGILAPDVPAAQHAVKTAVDEFLRVPRDDRAVLREACAGRFARRGAALRAPPRGEISAGPFAGPSRSRDPRKLSEDKEPPI